MNDQSMAEIYGSALIWDQSRWAELDRLLDTWGEPLTFEGKLYAATGYPEITAAKITLEDAVDAALCDLGTRSDDAVTFKSIDEYLSSYRTTILDGGMDAVIEVFDVPQPRPESEGSPYGNG